MNQYVKKKTNMNQATSFTKLPPIVKITKDVYKITSNPLRTWNNRTMATFTLPKMCHRRIVLPEAKRNGLRWLCLDFRTYSENTKRRNGFLGIRNNINVYCSCIRVHSSVSHRNSQKMLLESKMAVLEKDVLPMLDKSMLPSLEKKDDDVGIMKRCRDTADPYMKLMRVDKPIGTWLLFWPCSWSIMLASISAQVPISLTLEQLALFLAGSFIMRGAGCTINDLWDRDIDKKVERTRDRPLVSGALTERQAYVFLAAQLTAGVCVLMQLNWYSVMLGASSMVLVVTYPLAKRFTNYPQLFLGATFNWGALLGWSSVCGHVDPTVCLPLYGAALCWTLVYDTIYAHQDKLDDARIGIKSTALTFGSHTKPLLSLFGCASLAGLAGAGCAVELAWPYYAALCAAGAHVGKQIYTLDPDNPDDCATKFKSNSLVGLIIFLGIVAGGWQHYRDKKPITTNEYQSIVK